MSTYFGKIDDALKFYDEALPAGSGRRALEPARAASLSPGP